MPFLNELRRWAVEKPTTTAVKVGASQLSFAELASQARALLSPSAPGTTVICEPNSTSLVAGFCAAVAGTGRVAVLDPHWPSGVLSAVREEISRIPDAPGLDGYLPNCLHESFHDSLHDGPSDSSFLIGLTSGTTSRPKGFSRSRRSWAESFRRSADYFGLSPEDVTLAPGPLSASLNLYALGECLHTGTPFHTLESFSPDAALEAIGRDGVTRLVLVPTMLALLAGRGLALRDSVSSDAASGHAAEGLRSIVCAGSRLDAATVAAVRRWAPNAELFQYYGAAELGFVAADKVPAVMPDIPGRAGVPTESGLPTEAGAGFGTTAGSGPAAGLPFPGVEVSIRDAAGEPQPPGTAGTIHVRSNLVCDGYLWGDDGLAFNRRGEWTTVRDQGFLDSAGALHVLGRESDMIVHAGHNVYPHEVEEVLARAAGDGQLLVAGTADGLRGQRVVAAVVPGSGGAVDAAQLRAAAAALPGYKRPSRYYQLSELPLTNAGKVSRTVVVKWIETEDGRAQRIF